MFTSTIAGQTHLPGTTQLPVSLRTGQDFQPLQPTATVETVLLPFAEDFKRSEAVAENLSMVRFLARQIHTRLPEQVELEELISAGTLGLVDAAAKFEGCKKVQFRSYAQFRIRGAILDSLRSTDWSPRSLRRQGRAIEQATCTLIQRGVESPGESEIAAELGLELTTYQHLLGELKGLEVGSLQLERSGETGEQEISFVPGPATDDPLFRCLQGEMRERLVAAIDTLPEKERLVLSLYYYEELTMREISQVLGVVESRISQMHSSAVLRLRAVLGAVHKHGMLPSSARAGKVQAPATRGHRRTTLRTKSK